MEVSFHRAVCTWMFGRDIVLLNEYAVRIVLAIACDDRVGALRPEDDRSGSVARPIALLAQGLAIIDVVIDDIDLPILAPDRHSSLARNGYDVPVGCNPEGRNVRDRICRVTSDLAGLTKTGAAHDLDPMADVVICHWHLEVMLARSQRLRHPDAVRRCLQHRGGRREAKRVGIIVKRNSLPVADLIAGTRGAIL